jgi:hypothetical protein
MSVNVEDVKKQFAKEITALENKAREEGRASARGLAPGVSVAERLAEKARALQAANPKLSNTQAVRMAYEAEGVPLE